MQHFKDGVERLLRRLVGRWDFVLYDGDLGDTSIHRRYVVQGLVYESEEIAAFGYNAGDQTPFYMFFLPTTIQEKDYLFHMSDRDESDQTRAGIIYNFNQREGNTIWGVFTLYDLRTQRKIAGDFFAHYDFSKRLNTDKDQSVQESCEARSDLPPRTLVTFPIPEVQERHEGGESPSLAVEEEEAGEEESMSEEVAVFEHRMQEDERDYYLGKYGVDIDALEYRYDEGRTMEYGDEGYDIDNEHDTLMDYGIGEDIFDEEE